MFLHYNTLEMIVASNFFPEIELHSVVLIDVINTNSALHTVLCCFLADRTNGRAIATLLRLSVVVCRL